jgi:hypothetical protein
MAKAFLNPCLAQRVLILGKYRPPAGRSKLRAAARAAWPSVQVAAPRARGKFLLDFEPMSKRPLRSQLVCRSCWKCAKSCEPFGPGRTCRASKASRVCTQGVSEPRFLASTSCVSVRASSAVQGSQIGLPVLCLPTRSICSKRYAPSIERPPRTQALSPTERRHHRCRPRRNCRAPRRGSRRAG